MQPQETWTRYLDQEDPLEWEMATHSRILAWNIPWTEEPGGLQSIGVTKSQTSPPGPLPQVAPHADDLPSPGVTCTYGAPWGNEHTSGRLTKSCCKKSPYCAGDMGLNPGLGRSTGGQHDNPLQYSCWEIPWTEEPGRLQSMGL